MLFLDTTGYESVFFAFAPKNEKKKIVFKNYKLLGKSSAIAENLQKFLKFARIRQIKEVLAICVATGEGSFAGIRAGAALALGISLASNIPVYSVDAKIFKKMNKKQFNVFLSVLSEKPEKALAKKSPETFWKLTMALNLIFQKKKRKS